MGKKFNDFINKMDEEAKNNKKSFNPEEKIVKFKNHVNSLYADIDAWLHEGIESKKILTGLVPITITEEQLGTYTVNEKWIQIGNARIQFHPVGTILIGTDARVDMTYGNNYVTFVRTGENYEAAGDLIEIRFNGELEKKKKSPGKIVWKYVKNDLRRSYVTLDKERFENLIIEVVNGNR